jgi:hypothetical protein
LPKKSPKKSGTIWKIRQNPNLKMRSNPKKNPKSRKKSSPKIKQNLFLKI